MILSRQPSWMLVMASALVISACSSDPPKGDGASTGQDAGASGADIPAEDGAAPADVSAPDTGGGASDTGTADAAPEDTGGDGPPLNAEKVPQFAGTTNIVCPGGPGCAGTGDGKLMVGFGKRVITPPIEKWEDANKNRKYDRGEKFEDLNGNGKFDPVWVAGFGMGKPAAGVHDDMWARVVVFKKNDITIALGIWDCVGFMHDQVIEIRRLAKEKGLDVDHIMIASTHTHQAADTLGIWGEGVGKNGTNPLHLESSRIKTVEAIEEALANMKTATMAAAKIPTPPEWNRDTRIPYFVDYDLYAVKVMDESGKVFGTFTLYGNHPEAAGSGNNLISSDFAHMFRLKMEEAFPGSTSVYFQGMVGGLMTPLNIKIPRKDGTMMTDNNLEMADRLGELLAEKTLEGLGNATGTIAIQPDAAIGFRRYSFLLPLENMGLRVFAQLGAITRNAYDENGRLVTNRNKISDAEYKIFIQTEVNAVDIGPLQFATIPGEIYPEIGSRDANGKEMYADPNEPNVDFPGSPREPIIRDQMRKNAAQQWIFGLANDELGYMIPKSQWDQVTPCAYGKRECQYGEINSAGPNYAPTVANAFQRMMAPDWKPPE
ncbi:MAG: hypothetical protein GMKNLPBB_00705 [Myxococcota bacterium]|nr:hypothetical protein [Myxococcota bacterium]